LIAEWSAALRQVSLSRDLDRREMSRVYREMESGKRGSQEGRRLVFVLGQLERSWN